MGTSRRWRCWRTGAEPVEGVPAGLLVAGAAALPVSLAALRQRARPEVLPLLAGQVPSGSRAGLLVLLFPLPWRLFPWLFPMVVNACGPMRTIFGPRFPCSRCSRCESTRKGFAWCSSRRGAGAAGRAGAQRQQPAGGADRAGRALGASAWLRGATGPTGPAVGTPRGWRCWPGWSRACPPGAAVPAALAVVPVAVPDGGERMRTHANNFRPPVPAFPLFPLRKHPERLRVVFFASRCWRCWPGRRRAGRGRGPALLVLGGGGRTALAGYMAGRPRRFPHRQGSEKLQRLPCDVSGTTAFRYQR